jgi:hypothetical protein
MMQVCGKGGSQVLEGASARSPLEQENAALRLALAQAHEDLAVVEEIAQVATKCRHCSRTRGRAQHDTMVTLGLSCTGSRGKLEGSGTAW